MERKSRAFSLLSHLLITLSLFHRGSSERASLPPRGWNSYDSFCWVVSEEEFLQNAELVAQKLKSHGYEYVVVDYLWYRRKVQGAYVDSLGFDVIDEWGRMVPDPGRWPSSKDGKGFSEVAKKVHGLGLKFGIHVMKGISTQAVNANNPILDITKGSVYEESGRQWHAKDIGIESSPCVWMRNGFMSVNTKLGAGRTFLRSLYQQYADWGVDFVKHDCVFGSDMDLNEITTVSEVLRSLDRPILYSLSPGENVTPASAKQVLGLVNMYRITGDDWDEWGDVASHFDVSRDFSAANMTGARGLLGKSWPDLDMLPLGWLTSQGTNDGPYRTSNLTLDEQKTQMTLWSMAKSPIMFGGDMRKLDQATYSLITNPTLLEINFFSSNNKEFPYVAGKSGMWSINQSLSWNLKGSEYTKTPKRNSFGLTNCDDPGARGWSSRALGNDLQQVCWEGSTKRSRYEAPVCLYKRQPLLKSGKEIAYEPQHKYKGKLHLTEADGAEFCLDTSPKTKRASQEFESSSFSPCKLDANQMWELSDDGTLRNSHSNLCAYENKVKVVPGGVRSWIATGRRGEIYLAFFNLNPVKTSISAKISDLTRELSRANNMTSTSSSCTYKEVWSRKDLGQLKQIVSMEVESHGCALFSMNCNHELQLEESKSKTNSDIQLKWKTVTLLYHVLFLFL